MTFSKTITIFKSWTRKKFTVVNNSCVTKKTQKNSLLPFLALSGQKINAPRDDMDDPKETSAMTIESYMKQREIAAYMKRRESEGFQRYK